MKFTTTKLAAGVALACAAGVSQGALYSFQDDDIDFIIRNNTLVAPGSVLVPNPILVGDVFVAAFTLPTATRDGVPIIPAGQELTGVAAVQLTGCSVGGIASPCTAPGAVYTFGAYTGGLNSILTLGGGQTIGTAGNAGGGATLAMFINSTTGANGDRDLNLDRSQLGGATNCTSYTDCITQASLGTIFQIDGFTGDPDNFWRSTQLNGGGDISDIAALGSTVPVSFSQFGLGTFFHADGTVGWQNVNTGAPCGLAGNIADGCVQWSGSATVTGGAGLANGAFAHSDFDADKLTVPAPGSLALLGLGLGVLGWASRKK